MGVLRYFLFRQKERKLKIMHSVATVIRAMLPFTIGKQE
jgi:hypothetical protein